MNSIQYNPWKTILAFLCLLAIILSVALPQGRPHLELMLQENILGAQGSPFVPIFKFLSAIGSMIFTGLLVTLLAFTWVYKKNYQSAFIYLTSFFLVLVFAYGLKIGLALPRPSESLWLAHAKSFTFPSGHASRIAFIMLTLHHFLPFKHPLLKPLFLFLAFLVLLSRVYLGVHYPLDVIAGFTIGYLGASLFEYALVKFNKMGLMN
jgi:undecaprenyl-diphosphatase